MQKEPGWKKDCSIASAPPYTHFWIIPGVSRLRQPSSGSLPRGRGSHAGNETFEKQEEHRFTLYRMFLVFENEFCAAKAFSA